MRAAWVTEKNGVKKKKNKFYVCERERDTQRHGGGGRRRERGCGEPLSIFQTFLFSYFGNTA